jgi:heme/copper-type cytochrome/quinol oxidase subunit 4
MILPKNVLRFEVLLYLSLTLDALSVAFQDRTPSVEMTESMIATATVMAAGLILLLVYFVWLAAQRRKNWPRWALAAALVLSIISLVQIIGDSGLQLDSGIEIISCILTAAGLYFSFTGDAQGWFNAWRIYMPSFRGDAEHRTSDVRLHIGESRDSGSGPSDHPGMTAWLAALLIGILYHPPHGMDRRRHRAGGAAAWRIFRHRRALDS